MLDQVIYTRCSKCRDILNNGEEVKQDGFSIYSISESLFSNFDKRDINFISNRIKSPNASDERGKQGLIESYEYYILPSGKKMISKICGRPYSNEHRKNGASHRPGTFINQTYIGDLNGYIFEKFYSPDWNADKKTETEYYHDEPDEVVPYLNILDRDMYNGILTIENIREFIADGRERVYREALFFIIQEFSKKEGERKVLLIKDVPENVAMWIAGFSLALSDELAGKLTFSTNKTRLGIQTESVLFYYTDSSGKVCMNRAQNTNMVKRPYCMIVGYHPLDSYSNSLKQYPNSNYVILDGVKMQIGFEAEAEKEEIYYLSASKMQKDIRFFCDVILDNYSVHDISDDISKLFGAYKYMIDDETSYLNWEYEKVCNNLEIINSFGESKDIRFTDKIFTKIVSVYSKRFNKDEKNNYKLLKMLKIYAVTLGKEEYIEDLLADKVHYAILSMKTSEDIVYIWKSLQSDDMKSFLKDVLVKVFNDTELPIYSQKISDASEASVNVVLDMYFYMLDLDRVSYDTILSNHDIYVFIYRGINRIKNNEKIFSDLIIKMSDSLDLLSNIIYSVILSNIDSDLYVKTFVANCKRLPEIVEKISTYQKVNFKIIEVILKEYIIINKCCDDRIFDIYDRKYRNIRPDNNYGTVIFDTWINVLNVNEFGKFCERLIRSNILTTQKENLFEKVDNMLSFDSVIVTNTKNINAISNLAKKLDVYSRTEELYKLYMKINKAKTIEEISFSIETFLKADVEFKISEINSKYIVDIMQKVALYIDEYLHFLIMSMFIFNDNLCRNKYTQEYIKISLSCIRRNEIPNQIIALCHASILESNSVLGMVRADEAKRALNINIVDGILPFYKSNFAEQIEKKKCDPIVKKKVMLILKEVDEKTPKGIGGFISNIFGKNKK